ncbi:MAG: SMR family transporter [Methylovirgula sp.]|uniref:SMR family transporter n=1 Tax=Methylovirgula sp. TaxID=1978224 RepID=UPI0030766ADC
MSTSVFVVVLLAAALHASWNAVVKVGKDTDATAILVSSAAAFIALLALPFLHRPAIASWPFLATSAIIHIAYFLLVARAYRTADMGQAYPLMRGAAPIIVAVVSTTFLGGRLSHPAMVGIALICFGVAGMAFGTKREHFRGTAYAVGNAVVIASYTLVDGLGARNSGSPFAYAFWIFLLSGAPLGLWLITVRRESMNRLQSSSLWRAFLGGAASILSYSLVLWAMTVASIPTVAALRETAILFGAAISILVLKENARPIRAAASGVIAAGAAMIRLA